MDTQVVELFTPLVAHQMAGRLVNKKAIQDFIFAGNATFTMMNIYLDSNKNFKDNIEIWHEGKCGRCGRKLTVPESIELGFGKECLNLLKRHE